MTDVYTLDAYRAYLATGQLREAGKPMHPVPLPPADTSRYRSKTETRYAALLDIWQHEGEILRWWYEPQKGLKLGPKTSYTPDFLLDYGPGRPLEFHEVKGAHIWPVDWVKVKQAAVLFPCYRFILAQWKQGEWHWQGIPAV